MPEQIDEITIDGNRYISVKRAASLSEYTPDYVGQLCRLEKIEATRVGRNWYVLESSIIEHKQDTLFQQGKNEEIVQNRPLPKRKKIFKSSFIIYSKDDRPLLPELSDKTPKKAAIPLHGVIRDEESVPNSIFTVASKGIGNVAKETIDYFTPLRRITTLGIAAAVFLGIFTLNASYGLNLLSDGAGNVANTVSSTEFVGTVDSEILDSYRKAAIEFHERVDATIELLSK